MITCLGHLRLAHSALAATAPHGRDYVGREDDYVRARSAHRARFQRLLETIQELEALGEHCADKLP